jgi:hypothetical protein
MGLTPSQCDIRCDKKLDLAMRDLAHSEYINKLLMNKSQDPNDIINVLSRQLNENSKETLTNLYNEAMRKRGTTQMVQYHPFGKRKKKNKRSKKRSKKRI